MLGFLNHTTYQTQGPPGRDEEYQLYFYDYSIPTSYL
jgi:hypothetical protein